MKKYMGSTEAADYLGVSRSTLGNWVRRNLLAATTTPGGHYRFAKDELDGFAQSRGFEIKGAMPKDSLITAVGHE